MFFFQNLKILYKFVLGFAVIVLIIGAINIYLQARINQINQRIIYHTEILESAQQLFDYSNASFGLMYQYLLVENTKELESLKPKIADSLYMANLVLKQLGDKKIDSYLLRTAENYLQLSSKISQELTYDHDLRLGMSSRKESIEELEKIKAAERDKLLAIQDLQYKIEGIVHEIVDGSRKNFVQAQTDFDVMQQASIFVFAGGLVFAFVLSIFMSKMILRPIEKLSEAVSEAGSGNLSYVLINKSSDEIGSLVRNFNIMRIQLKSYLDQVTESKQNLEETQKKLEEKLEELEKFKKLTVGRELRMIEMREEMGKLRSQISEESKNKP